MYLQPAIALDEFEGVLVKRNLRLRGPLGDRAQRVTPPLVGLEQDVQGSLTGLAASAHSGSAGMHEVADHDDTRPR